MKVALTAFAALIVRVHVGEVPVHAPVQPGNVLPASGAAVRTTVDPASYVAAQERPQEMPAGEDVTVPPPERVTVSA